MQNAEVVLSILSEKAGNDKNYVFSRLYRHLFNPTFYQEDKQELPDITNHVIQQLKNESFDPKNMQQSSKMVADALLRILDTVYQKQGDKHATKNKMYPSLSHLCTCLGQYDWMIQGNITPFTKNSSEHLLGVFLKRKIQDNRLIALVKKFLNTTYGKHFLLRLEYAMDDFFSNLFPFYIRKQQEYLIGISGTKEQINHIREGMHPYNSILTKDNTRIINFNHQAISFAGYTLYKRKNGSVKLQVPQHVIEQKIKPFIYKGKSVPIGNRLNMSLHAIVKQYNAEIQNFRETYGQAQNFNVKFRKFRYYHYKSFLKTLATKEKTSVKNILKKYGLVIKTKDGKRTRSVIQINFCQYSGFASQ